MGAGAVRLLPPLAAGTNKEVEAVYRAAAARRGACSRASATSAIIFSMMASPNELKSLATSTKAPGPPTTLVR